MLWVWKFVNFFSAPPPSAAANQSHRLWRICCIMTGFRSGSRTWILFLSCSLVCVLLECSVSLSCWWSIFSQALRLCTKILQHSSVGMILWTTWTCSGPEDEEQIQIWIFPPPGVAWRRLYWWYVAWLFAKRGGFSCYRIKLTGFFSSNPPIKSLFIEFSFYCGSVNVS